MAKNKFSDTTVKVKGSDRALVSLALTHYADFLRKDATRQMNDERLTHEACCERMDLLRAKADMLDAMATTI